MRVGGERGRSATQVTVNVYTTIIIFYLYATLILSTVKYIYVSNI